MALSSTHNCFSSALFTSYIKNQEKSLFTRSKVNFTSSNIFVRSSFLLTKCDFNGHLIPVETGFDDSSTIDGSVKHFKVSSDHSFSPKQNKTTVSVTVVGASGDLAKKKIFPALFALYYENFLPEHFTIFGYARSKMSDEELRNMISQTLTCRIDKRENCGDKMKKFLQRCFYQSGQYDSEENFKELDEKLKEKEVKVLRSMRPLQIEDVVIGQYKGHSKGGKSYPSYTDDPKVANNSLTPTFAAAAMFIDNARWDGVPFLMKAGKALHSNGAEIRVQFRHVPGNLYRRKFGTYLDKNTNELVIRVQPNEAIYLKINNKVPGLGMRVDRSNLNLLYSAKYSGEIPDAYERLLLDAIEGERRLFIRSDELDAAWALFTPLLRELEDKHVSPELYPFGSRGPVGAHYLAAKYNVRWGDFIDGDS